MKTLALIFPVLYKKFYINPFHLQKLQSVLFFSLDKIDDENTCADIVLIDINNPAHRKLIESHDIQFDLCVVDIPEGQLYATEYVLKNICADLIVLTGEEIKYGVASQVYSYLKQFSSQIVMAIDDEDVITAVIQYLKNGTINCSDNVVIRSFDTNVLSFSNLKPDFPKWMGSLYDQFGIQIFMDGISRGCENNCFFCKLNNTHLDNHRKKIVDSGIDIISTIKNICMACEKIPYIQFTDENFFGRGSGRLIAIQKLCDGLEQISYNGFLGIDSRLDSVFNPNDSEEIALLRKNTWQRLAKNGLRYCFFGIETFSHEQAQRYNKALDLQYFSKVIRFVEDNNIFYTIGLILWDPLMSKDDILTNLSFIKDNNLLGKTASLLKCLRVQVNSQYAEKYGTRFIITPSSCQDGFNLDDSSITYLDKDINSIIPFVRFAYDSLNEHGYRHSDVALFEVMFDIETPQILRQIPFLVAKYEYNVLIFLLNCAYVDQQERVLFELRNMVKDLVDRIMGELEKLSLDYGMNNNTVLEYYNRVFLRVRDSL